MKKKSIKITFLLSIFAVIFIVGYFILNTPQTSWNTNANKTISTQSSQNNQPQKIKFSDSPYWSYAYLISNNNLNDQAKVALSGFDRKMRTLSDGSVEITLKALSSDYSDQKYILKKGEKLYFIETSLSDDSQFKEYNLGDDIAVKVDSNGYVLK